MTIGINSVQQVSITIASGSTTGTATISAITGSALLFFQGCQTSVATNSAEAFARVSISGTTVTATRPVGTAGTCVVNAAIVDADSSLVASVQMGTITVSSGTSGTTTISAVTTTNSAIHLLGSTSSITSVNFGDNTPILVLTNSTTVTATVRTRSGTCIVGYMVVAFQAAALNQNTQPISKSWTNSSLTTTQAITSVNVNNTMIFFGGCDNDANETNAADQQIVKLTSATALTFSTGVAEGDSAIVCNCTVVEFVSGVLQQSAQRGASTIAAGTSVQTDTVTSATPGASLLNMTGYTTTTTVITSLSNILPNITQASATTITSGIGGTVPSGKNTVVGWELLTFTIITTGQVATWNAAVSFSAIGAPLRNGVVTWSPSVAFSPKGRVLKPAVAILSPQASLTATGRAGKSAVASWTSNAILAAIGASLKKSSAIFSPHAVLAVVGSAFSKSSFSSSPTATFSATGNALLKSSATWSPKVTASFVGSALKKSVATFSPSAVLNAVAANNHIATFSASAIFSAVGITARRSAATWSPHATFSATGHVIKNTKAAFNPSATFNATGNVIKKSSALFSPNASLGFGGRRLISSAANLSPSAVFLVVGNRKGNAGKLELSSSLKFNLSLSGYAKYILNISDKSKYNITIEDS